MVQLLLENGTDINRRTKTSWGNSTARREACKGSKSDMVQLLLKNGASFDAEEDRGILEAVKAENYGELAKSLIARDGVASESEEESPPLGMTGRSVVTV